MSKTNQTKVQCPVCGANFAIPEMETIAVGIVIGKDSGLGTVHPKLAEEQEPAPKCNMKAKERIEALRAAGVDVSHLFAMSGANGGECIASNKNGRFEVLNEDDPIFQVICQKGTIPNRSLFRRWVLAQMFRHMTAKSYRTGGLIGVTKSIHRLGYEYQWKMILNELYAQMKMQHKDKVNFNDRNRWFNRTVVAAMANDYIDKLKERINNLQTYKCKGVPYKRLCNENFFVDDLYKKIYQPLLMAMYDIKNAKTAEQLYNATVKFNKLRYHMAWGTPQCKEWLDAYKGAGAFFSMQNLIRFHGCRMVATDGTKLPKESSYSVMVLKAKEYAGEGWRMLGLLKKLLEDNNVDIERKMTEWRKKK